MVGERDALQHNLFKRCKFLKKREGRIIIQTMLNLLPMKKTRHHRNLMVWLPGKILLKKTTANSQGPQVCPNTPTSLLEETKKTNLCEIVKSSLFVANKKRRRKNYLLASFLHPPISLKKLKRKKFSKPKLK